MIKHITSLAAAATACAAAAAWAQPAAAGVGDFYSGKRISIYVGFYPGGGYDTYARALGQHMGKLIPGKPDIMVRNLPGASSMRAANFIYNSAPKDGTAMGVFNAGTVFGPLLGNKKAKFAPDKFSWIGNIDQIIGNCAVWHTSGVRTFDDVLKQPVIFGAAGPSGSQSEYPRGINALLGARIQVIHGYAGGTGALLAMKRGEVQGGCAFALSTLNSVRRQDWKEGRLIVVANLSLKKPPELKGIPNIYDYAKTESDRQTMELIFGRQALGRPFAGPPGQPGERTEALRAAFMKTMTDPGFKRDAARRNIIIDPLSGEEVEKLIARYLGFPKDVVMRARAALKVGDIKKVKLKKLAGTIEKLSKMRITVKGADGKSHVFKIHDRRSRVKIGGKKAKTNALEAGMACTFRHYGEKDLARNIDCK
jgi:tripartite-type tricarboxylate transporter receptor subunit TctC